VNEDTANSPHPVITSFNIGNSNRKKTASIRRPHDSLDATQNQKLDNICRNATETVRAVWREEVKSKGMAASTDPKGLTAQQKDHEIASRANGGLE